jgi:hypothetical protein
MPKDKAYLVFNNTCDITPLKDTTCSIIFCDNSVEELALVFICLTRLLNESSVLVTSNAAFLVCTERFLTSSATTAKIAIN